MTVIGNAWKALARIDDGFVEFGRMPVRDEFWDDSAPEEPVYTGWKLAIGYWMIGLVIPTAIACAYAYWACHGNIAALWYGWSMV